MAQEKVESSAAAKKEMAPQNKRRKELGVEVHNFDGDSGYFFSAEDSRYIRGLTTELELEKRFNVGTGHFERSDRMNLLRRSKLFLARRSFADLSEENRPKLYGAKNKIETVLDCFPSVKYSYSSSLPPKVVMRNHGIPEEFYGRCKPNEVRYFDVCCAPDGSSKKARMSDVSRSANIRLDPMDAPRQLFIYRCRIRRCIAWGYSVGLVPIMMTLTIFHRWNPLRGLLRVLSRSWDRFFASGRPAVTRTKQMGVQAYIRRLEETITNGKGTQGYNSGWHPHYHVILFVPKENLSLISDMEEELQEAWFEIVNHFFAKEFGEEIDPSYASAFKKHGLVFSRYSDFDMKPSERKKSRCVRFAKRRKNGKRPIRPVDDSDYMAKTVGCDPQMLYTGESEMTSIHAKNSRIPFDLLCDDTAENNDLWVEYAIATKGLRSFVFSRGLGGRVRKYFEAHPERDSVKSFVKSDKVVAQLDNNVYHLLYRTCTVDKMLRVAVKGYDSLCDWFTEFYLNLGYTVSDITDDMMPLPPGTCSPFGDRLDILTLYRMSRIKSNDITVKTPCASVRDGEARAEKKSNTKRPRDAKIFKESTTSAISATQFQTTVSAPSPFATTSPTVTTSTLQLKTASSSATASGTSSHPIQLELQFYPDAPCASVRDGEARAEKKSNTKRPRDAKIFKESTTSAISATQFQTTVSAPSPFATTSPTVMTSTPQSKTASSSTDTSPLSTSVEPSSVSAPSITTTDTVTHSTVIESSSPSASAVAADFPLAPASSSANVEFSSAANDSVSASAPPVSSQSSDEDSLDDDASDIYDSASADAARKEDKEDLPGEGFLLDARTRHIRLLKNISDALVTHRLCGQNISQETLDMVAESLEKELQVVLANPDAKLSKFDDIPSAPSVPDDFSDSDEVWMSSESYSPFEKFDDNSIEARLNEVSNSKWYPDWYKARLRNLKASSDCAAANSASVADIHKRHSS